LSTLKVVVVSIHITVIEPRGILNQTKTHWPEGDN